MRRPCDDWIAPLTRGMPEDIEWALISHNDGSFDLVGTWHDQELFKRSEVLDHDQRCTKPGNFIIKPFDSGYRGLGLLYVRNALDWFECELGFDRMEIYAGHESGGRVWAEAGFEFMTDKMQQKQHYNGYIDQMNRRFREVAPRLDAAEKETLRAAIGDMRHDPRAIWRIADMDINLSNRLSGTRLAFYSARLGGSHAREIRTHHHGAIPLAAYMLNNSAWYGVMRADDPAQILRLDKAIAVKGRFMPTLQAVPACR